MGPAARQPFVEQGAGSDRRREPPLALHRETTTPVQMVIMPHEYTSTFSVYASWRKTSGAMKGQCGGRCRAPIHLASGEPRSVVAFCRVSAPPEL